jgi:hypothetical protein
MRPEPAGYERYASSLGTEEEGPSEWAPFSSRLEWEVACWAKLRGPGSTALSELLQINGVGFHDLVCSRVLNYTFSAFGRTWAVIFKLGRP